MYDSRGGYWPIAAFVDFALLVPLVTYDLVTLKGRLHPSTKRGMAVLFCVQAIMLSLWGSSVWREFAYHASHAIARLA